MKDTDKTITKKKLLKKIHDYLIFKESYYNGNPVITDPEFDKLEKAILSYRKEYPDLVKRIDIVQAPGKSDIIKHTVQMWSLDNVFTIDELDKWMSFPSDTIYSAELKYDGASLDGQYRKGGLAYAITRGDGKLGTSIIENTKSFLPKKIGDKDINIHGEVILNYKDFELLNERRVEEDIKPYISPRNAAASIMMHGGPGVDKLKFIPYAYYKEGVRQNIKDIPSKRLIDTIPFIFTGTKEEIFKEIEREYSITKRAIPADGLVIKVVDEELIKSLGYTSKFPKHAIALKFPDVDVSTTLLNVIWQVGHTGVLTPVGILEPVDLGDAIVSRVTLNNLKFVMVTDLAYGCKVNIIKSGGVIPKLTGVLDMMTDDIINTPYIKIPATCPECTGTLAVVGPNLKCKNEKCRGRVISKLTRFASRDYANIRDVSRSTIEKLFTKGVRTFLDLLTVDKEMLSKIDGMGEKRIANILKSMQKVKGLPMDKFLASLGIDGLGKTTGKIIAEKIDSISDIGSLGLNDMKGIGLTKGMSIGIGIIFDMQNIEALEEWVKPKKISNIEKQKVCFTGKFDKTRKELENEWEENGYEIVNRVTTDLNILIAGYKPSSKLEKAKKLGIKIIYLF